MSDLLPIGEAFEASALAQAFEVREHVPPANPEHTFWMRVPRGWELHRLPEMDREVGLDVLTPLAAFQGPGAEDDPPPIFHVQAMTLDREITAKNLLLAHAIGADMMLHVLRELSPVFADALFQQDIDGAHVMLRQALAIDGDRAFMLSGIVVPERYAELSETFGAMVASFRVARPSHKRTIERWREYVLEPGEVRFEHPASFRPLLVDGSDAQRALVSLYGFDSEDNIGGILHVESQRGRELPIDAEYERLLEVCRGMNVRPNGDPEEIALEVEAGRYRALGMRRYPAQIPGNDLDQDIMIALLAADDLVVRMWMTTPAKRGSFLHWAQNRRAFEIVLGTLR